MSAFRLKPEIAPARLSWTIWRAGRPLHTRRWARYTIEICSHGLRMKHSPFWTPNA